MGVQLFSGTSALTAVLCAQAARDFRLPDVSILGSQRTDEPATCARLGSWLAGGENEILKRVMGTEHYRSLNRGGAEKVEISDQSQGLFSTLGEIAKVLRMMPASAEGRRRFSLREWKKDRQGWVFLCSEAETQEAIMPLHTAIADMAILHTQAEVYDRDVPRVWFVLDEAATMGRIGQLESGMTKQRASGDPIVLGFHDSPQLEQATAKRVRRRLRRKRIRT